MTDLATTTPGDAGELLAGVDRLTLEAAMLAEPGTIDHDAIPCATCGVPAVLHPGLVLVLADPGHEHQVPPAYELALRALEAESGSFMQPIVDGIRAEYVPSGSLTPRPSDAGACPRSVWYRVAPPAGYEPRTDIDEARAAIGTLIHEAGRRYRPVVFPWRHFELKVQVPGLERDGYVDEYDPITGTVFDTKSAGKAKWLILADGPPQDMWKQVRIYGWALYLAGYPVRRLCIWAVNRDTGADEQHWEEFDPETAVAAVDELAALATMLDAGVVPERTGRGPRDWRCQWCPAMLHCWQVDRAAELGRGPVSLTILGEQPGTPAIVHAGREFLRENAALKALKDRVAYLKDLLQGLPAGTYGSDDWGVKIADSRSTSVGYKEAYEDLLRLWDLPENQRPRAAELPGPTVTKTVTQTAQLPRRAGTAAGARMRKASPAEKVAAAAVAAAGGETVTTPTTSQEG